MRPLTVSLVALAVVLAAGWFAAPAGADWDPKDGHKMHFPQLPDPSGWDVQTSAALADDWLCTATGPVSDVHFWISWRDDRPGTIDMIQLQIYDDDRTGEFSQPGEFKWRGQFEPGEFTVREYGSGDQGFFNPNIQDSAELHDHEVFYQVNIENIPDPFTQDEGNIYWLKISLPHTGGAPGWKTTLDHFEDAATYWDVELEERRPLLDPYTGERLDLAFVITPEPGTMAMILGAGLTGLMVWVRRRRCGC